MTTSPIVIRIAFIPYWIWTTSGAAIIGIIPPLFDIEHISHLHGWYGHVAVIICAYLVGVTAGAIFTAIAVTSMYWLLPCRVTNTDIRGYNFWGFPSKSSWSEVTEMKPINLLGLKYLRIYSKGHYWALWFPLQISNCASTHESLANLDEKPRQLLVYLGRA